MTTFLITEIIIELYFKNIFHIKKNIIFAI